MRCYTAIAPPQITLISGELDHGVPHYHTNRTRNDFHVNRRAFQRYRWRTSIKINRDAPRRTTTTRERLRRFDKFASRDEMPLERYPRVGAVQQKKKKRKERKGTRTLKFVSESLLCAAELLVPEKISILARIAEKANFESTDPKIMIVCFVLARAYRIQRRGKKSSQRSKESTEDLRQ